MQAVIHFSRIGKGESIYREGLVHDDGVRLDTSTILPPQAANVWRKSAWQAHGILSAAETIHSVRKHHFYQEWFDIIELLDDSGAILGYYCDIATPLKKVNDEYFVQDLLLDLWIFPDGRYVELDWDEFNDAVQQGLLPIEYQQKAEATLRKLVAETKQGKFPKHYLNGSEA
jgi:predicted RNA-binding protein associated with RNAse of E/G family